MPPKPKFHFNRLTFLIGLSVLITLIIIGQLFYLQIIRGDYYLAIAQKEHLGYIELPARRGEILTKDYASNETYKLATNITLSLLFADPTLIENPQLVVDTFTPFLYDIEEEKLLDEIRIQADLKKAVTDKEALKVQPKNEEELLTTFKDRFRTQISQKIREKILLTNDLVEEIAPEVEALNLPGIEIKKNNLWAYPKQIDNRGYVAKKLSPYLDITTAQLDKILEGQNRYVILKRKIDPALTEQIEAILKDDPDQKFTGIRMQEEYYRFYPENELAAQILGFVDHNGNGQYGIENGYQKELKGKEGIFSSQRDASGMQITVGDSEIRPAVDGDNIILTIDRSVQMEVEKMLAQAVADYRADSGQVIVIDPQTARVIAMASAPTFNPNVYSQVFEKKEIKLNADEISNLIPRDSEAENPTEFWLYINTDTHERLLIFKEETETGTVYYEIFENRVGPEVYRNKMVADVFEPGSIFKVVTMAAALDSQEVTPLTRHSYTGPIEVDEFEIHNAGDNYYGRETMTEVLEHSSNVGMSWVARQLGRNLFHSYMINFGLGERTDIELENEHPGQIQHFTKWAESELVTYAFGQGILVSPIQMVTAVAVIANGGVLMQPYLVDSIEHADGKTDETDPKIIHRVITKETADTLSAMMTSTVENGFAKTAQVAGHYVAGKTGTAQTYKHGKALTGAGTTITSFVGFAPIDQPKFAILIKLDRPRASEWGSETAGPLFSKIAEYLFRYYNIPPDK